MASIFQVNENNDIFANDNGTLAIAAGIEAIAQATRHAVEVRRGELIYARTRGIDYFSEVFSGSPNLLVFEAQIREAILAVPDVEAVQSFNAELIDNVVQYTATILTTLGATEISGSL